MAVKIVRVSDLKTRLSSLMEELESEGTPIYVTHHGKPKAVVVRYEDYEGMLEKMEDLEDLLAMKEAMESPEEESLSLEEYERQRARGVRG